MKISVMERVVCEVKSFLSWRCVRMQFSRKGILNVRIWRILIRGRSERIWWTISGGLLERCRIQRGDGRWFWGINVTGAILNLGKGGKYK